MSDLDDEELEATRRLNGVAKESDIEENIKTINKTIYQENGEHYNYIDIDNHTPEEECEKFIISIENLLQDYARQKQINEEHKKINGELREKVKELEAKLEFQKFGDLDNIEFEEYMNQFIPKQKIKEKIEELKNEKEQLRIDKNVIWDSQIYKLDLKIQVLQELLQEEDK